MSSSIAIPASRGFSGFEQSRKPTSSSSASSYTSSSPQTPGSSKASSPSQSSDKPKVMHQRRQSLLSMSSCNCFFSCYVSLGWLFLTWLVRHRLLPGRVHRHQHRRPGWSPQIGTSTPAPLQMEWTHFGVPSRMHRMYIPTDQPHYLFADFLPVVEPRVRLEPRDFPPLVRRLRLHTVRKPTGAGARDPPERRGGPEYAPAISPPGTKCLWERGREGMWLSDDFGALICAA